jgi:hypothetical protein
LLDEEDTFLSSIAGILTTSYKPSSLSEEELKYCRTFYSSFALFGITSVLFLLASI